VIFISDPVLNKSSPMSPSEVFNVSINVMNNGTTQAEQDITVNLNNSEQGRESVTLGPGNSKELEFDLEAPNETGENKIRISSEDDSVNKTIEVQEVTEGQQDPKEEGKSSLNQLVANAFKLRPTPAVVDGVA